MNNRNNNNNINSNNKNSNHDDDNVDEDESDDDDYDNNDIHIIVSRQSLSDDGNQRKSQNDLWKQSILIFHRLETKHT
jgi:hypothetical protein